MPALTIDRPVWRSFTPKHLGRAADHVQRGGHAAIVDDDRDRVDLLLGIGADGRITELGHWSILAIEQERWRKVKSGAAKGLATCRVHREFEGSVIDWCERDSRYPGPTRRLRLDCLECGACCHDSNVVLYEEDLDRFRDGGRSDLLGKAYIKRARDGKVTLRFLGHTDCQHLRRDLKCRIYEIRPFNCRVFPVGSEACLAARESTRGWRD